MFFFSLVEINQQKYACAAGFEGKVLDEYMFVDVWKKEHFAKTCIHVSAGEVVIPFVPGFFFSSNFEQYVCI